MGHDNDRMASQFDEFEAFSATHAWVIVVFLAMLGGLTLMGRCARRRGWDRTLDHALAIVALVAWLLINLWWMWPTNFTVEESLPLHICDLAGLAAPIALRFSKQWSRAILYYWGLGLSTQGFITPGLAAGPARIGFWLFWANHFLVVGLALYDLIVRSYRPGWRDYRIATTLAVIYMALIFVFDLTFGLNYGYAGSRTLGARSIVDWLGPWPWRVVAMVALGYLVMALLTLPWVLTSKRHAARI